MRHLTPRVVRLFSSVLLVLALAAAVPLARAQQPTTLIAELVDYQDIRSVIPATTLDAFVQAFAPTAAQRTAASDLISAARDDVARVVNRHLRTVRDDSTYEQLKESESQVVKNAGAVERRMFDDLRSLLTPAQLERMPEFERAHRRSLSRIVRSMTLPVDLRLFFKRANFDPASVEGLRALVDKFDIEADVALVRERKAWMAFFADIRAGYDNSPEGESRRRRIERERNAASYSLTRVHAAVIEPLLGQLPEPVRDRLVMEIMTRRAEGFDRTAAIPDEYPVVREVLALNLSPEQRALARKLIDAAKVNILALARRCVVDEARYELADNATRAKAPTSPMNVFWGDASKVRVRVSTELLSMLSSEQRSTYDASPVLEPSSSSTVNDAP